MKPYNQLTNEEKLACLSLYPEEAKQDSNWVIRREAYRSLGYTEEAKQDSNPDIRREAELYFQIKNEEEVKDKEPALAQTCQFLTSEEGQKALKEFIDKYKK